MQHEVHQKGENKAFSLTGDMQSHIDHWQQHEPQDLEPQELHLEMEVQGMDMPGEVPQQGATATAAPADIDLPEHTANDIFMLEEEVEVER